MQSTPNTENNEINVSMNRQFGVFSSLKYHTKQPSNNVHCSCHRNKQVTQLVVTVISFILVTQCLITTHVISMHAAPMLRKLYSSLSSVASCAFSAHGRGMRVFDVRTSSSPLAYPCAKFCFCRSPVAELARGEKSHTQSTT